MNKDDFCKKSFGQLVVFPPSIRLEKGNSYPIIMMEDIVPGVRYVESKETKEWGTSSGSKFESGDILFARITPCLENRKIAIANIEGKGFGSTEFFVFRAIPTEICPKFLYYLSKTDLVVVSAINSYVGASGRQRADANFLKRVVLRVPGLVTQRKISSMLSAFDDLIKNNTRRIRLLEKIAQEIHSEWFIRMRFPGGKHAKDDKNLPSGWKRLPISKLCDEIRDGVKKDDLDDSELYIGLEHIPRKSIAFKEFATAGSVDSNKLRFRRRDILFGKIRPYLHKLAIAHWEEGACSTDTIVLRPTQRFYEGFLLFTVFNESFIELATISSKGTKMPRADWDFLGKQEIPVPTESLLKAYQDQFDAIFGQITVKLLENEHLAATRDLLLPRLISGQMSVENTCQLQDSAWNRNRNSEFARA